MPHSGMLKSGPGLYEFLIEAELQQYYSTIKNDLKVHCLKVWKGILNIYLFITGE